MKNAIEAKLKSEQESQQMEFVLQKGAPLWSSWYVLHEGMLHMPVSSTVGC